jgi:hypothetical protein
MTQEKAHFCGFFHKSGLVLVKIFVWCELLAEAKSAPGKKAKKI